MEQNKKIDEAETTIKVIYKNIEENDCYINEYKGQISYWQGYI